MKKILFLFPFSPIVAFASSHIVDFKSLVQFFLGIISFLIPIIFALTFIVLIWGIFKAWILHGDNETEIEKGKKIALWGIIGLVVMSGIWGILNILISSLI